MLTDKERERHYIAQETTESEKKQSYDRYTAVNKIISDIYKDKTVVDLGCGWGIGPQLILDCGASKVIGVDANEKALKEAHDMYPQDAHREYINAFIFDTKLPDNSADIVTCVETIEHNDYEERDLILKEVHRILRDNGYLYITTPEKRGGDFPSGSHWIEYDCDELVSLVKAQRFELVGSLRKSEMDSVSMALLFKKV